MNNTGKIIVAAAAGAAAGAILAILFAPDKGSETRRKISGEGKKLAHDLTMKFEKVKEKFDHLKQGVQQKAKEAAEEFA
jgi:gas vesicle protein